MNENKAALVALFTLLIATPAFGDTNCKYRGAAYSRGSAVCQSGTQYRCTHGQWSGLAIACTEDAAVGGTNCAFEGDSYSPGSASCQSGTQYRCDDGAWKSLALACTGNGRVAARMAPVGRTCMYNGATVATESSICKSGIAFRCEDGEWRNLGTTCQ